MISKKQGRACLAHAEAISIGADPFPATQTFYREVEKAWAVLGRGASGTGADEEYFDVDETSRDNFPQLRHQMVVASCFAAAIAGVKP